MLAHMFCLKHVDGVDGWGLTYNKHGWVAWHVCLSNASPSCFKQILFFKKWAIPGLFFFIFVFSIQMKVNNDQYKFRRWLDSNRGPLVLEATALPTEPQPLPLTQILFNTLQTLQIQCDKMDRLFVQYSDIYDNENLPNSFKSRLKILPNTK